MRRIMLFVFLSAILILTACSGNESTNSDTNSNKEENETNAEATNSKDLKIGVVLMTLSSCHMNFPIFGA